MVNFTLLPLVRISLKLGLIEPQRVRRTFEEAYNVCLVLAGKGIRQPLSASTSFETAPA